MDTTALFIVVFISLAAYFLIMKARSNNSKSVTFTDDEQNDEQNVEKTSINEVVTENEIKTAKQEETLDEIVSRLNNITSPDSDKPFAKISTPSVSEIPETLESIIDEPVETPKKRGRKKKSNG